MHQAFYRKWRPAVFDDVCGQEHITPILKYEVANNKISHAYLFCGSRGTGKTTCAKILAKAINCLNPQNGNPCGVCKSCVGIDSGAATDVLEMDAASNNGIDNIRDIRDEVVYTPAELKYRVYIVDEVHALSANAFNALLKTLEEPPAHVVFILATTEMHKLPATIISRCQRFDFKRISVPVISARLMFIAESEGLELTQDSARIIARLAQGGMRDAISLLELCSSQSRDITPALVGDLLGVSGRDGTFNLVCAIAEKSYEKIFAAVEEVASSSRDISVFWQELIGYYRDMLVFKTVSDAGEYLELSDSEEAQLKIAASKFSIETIIYHSRLLDETLYAIQRSAQAKRSAAELALIRMCDSRLDDTNAALLARISELEDRVAMLSAGSHTNIHKPETIQKPNNTAKTDRQGSFDQSTASTTADKPSDDRQSSQQEGTKPVLHTLSYWPELIDKIGRSNKSTASFLDGSRGYRLDPGGDIIIRVSKPFAVGVLSRPNDKEAIRVALCALEERDIAEHCIKIESASQKQADGDYDIDELIKNAGN